VFFRVLLVGFSLLGRVQQELQRFLGDSIMDYILVVVELLERDISRLVKLKDILNEIFYY
jgi:hypothetical protein